MKAGDKVTCVNAPGQEGLDYAGVQLPSGNLVVGETYEIASLIPLDSDPRVRIVGKPAVGAEDGEDWGWAAGLFRPEASVPHADAGHPPDVSLVEFMMGTRLREAEDWRMLETLAVPGALLRGYAMQAGLQAIARFLRSNRDLHPEFELHVAPKGMTPIWMAAGKARMIEECLEAGRVGDSLDDYVCCFVDNLLDDAVKERCSPDGGIARPGIIGDLGDAFELPESSIDRITAVVDRWEKDGETFRRKEGRSA